MKKKRKVLKLKPQKKRKVLKPKPQKKRKVLKPKPQQQQQPEIEKNPEKVKKDIETRMLNLVYGNALNEIGVDGLFNKLKATFAELTHETFNDIMEQVLWGADDKEGSPYHYLRLCILQDISLEEFSKHFPFVPKELLEKKAKWCRGQLSGTKNAAFIRGIGRLPLEGVKCVKLPKTTYKNSFETEIPVSKKNPLCVVINGANLGLPHSPLIADNKVRLALDYADDEKADFVVLANLIDIETKKASGYVRVLRAMVSGRNFQLKVFDPDYLKEAERIIKEAPENELVYETRNEVFEDLLAGLWKIAHIPPDERPQYSGKVYIVLGYKEEQLAAAAAYWAVAYYNKKKQDELLALKKMGLNALKRLRESEDPEEELAARRKDIEKIQKQEARPRITNVDIEWRRFFRRAVSYLVTRFEETVPNSKVIGSGTSYLKVRDQIVEINIPTHTKVTDGLLADRVRPYGQDVLAGRAADFVVVCHPYAIGYAATAREVDKAGHRDKRGFVCVAPICVDDETIRASAKEIIHRQVHPILKAVFSDTFSAGILRVDFVDGIPLASPVEIHVPVVKKNRKGRANESFAEKYIWYLEATDQHHGSRAKERIWCAEEEKYLGMCESAFHLFRKAGYGRNKLPPIHLYSANDDLVQGEHFGTHQHPHRHQLHYYEIERHVAELKEKILRAKDSEVRAQLMCDLQLFALYQFEVRGIDWVTNQLVEMYTRHLEPNVDMYSGMLLRAKLAGIVIRGVSDIMARPEVLRDACDPGFINWGSGNHFKKTVDGHLTEGGIYATQLRLLLRALPEWQGKENLLNKLVAAPLYSGRAIAMGTIQAPGGYEWGIDFRDTVPKMQGWLDPLRGAVRNESERGNYSRIFEEKVTLRSYGDKHFFGARRTCHSIHVMGPSSTHTDEYGEWGFPPNNTGVLFVGLPAAGPKAGPILIRPLLYQDLYRFMQRKETFDWEAFLPNAL